MSRPQVHLVRSRGGLAPHSTRRASIVLTAPQQGAEEEEAHRGSPRWSRARRLQWVFALALATGPGCPQGTLHRIATITHGPVIWKLRRYLQRGADPPPIAPARTR